jgi:hypothetical protein
MSPTALRFVIALPLVVGCNSSTGTTMPADGGAPDGTDFDACSPYAFDASIYAGDGGDAAPTIGAPCLPLAESMTSFDGVASSEINLETRGVASGSPTCISYHFEGRVTCPYGQSAAGQGPACAGACRTPNGTTVIGMVQPQCVDRPASKYVFYTCRCADAQGATNNDTYCTCPAGTTCKQMFAPLGGEDNFSGAYCLPDGLVDAGPSACSTRCDPLTAPCP